MESAHRGTFGIGGAGSAAGGFGRAEGDAGEAPAGAAGFGVNLAQGRPCTWRAVACLAAVLAVGILAGSRYRLSLAKGDFRLDLCPA